MNSSEALRKIPLSQAALKLWHVAWWDQLICSLLSHFSIWSSALLFYLTCQTCWLDFYSWNRAAANSTDLIHFCRKQKKEREAGKKEPLIKMCSVLQERRFQKKPRIGKFSALRQFVSLHVQLKYNERICAELSCLHSQGCVHQSVFAWGQHIFLMGCNVRATRWAQAPNPSSVTWGSALHIPGFSVSKMFSWQTCIHCL